MRQSHTPRNFILRFMASIADEVSFLLRRSFNRLYYNPPRVRRAFFRFAKTSIRTLSQQRLPRVRLQQATPSLGDLLHDQRPSLWGRFGRGIAQLRRTSVHYVKQSWHHVRDYVPANQRRIIATVGILATPIILGALVPIVVQGAVGAWQSLERTWEARFASDGIAGFFAPSVQHWRDDIVLWANDYALDPNLLATVMQIESCGHPTVVSHAGAQGLFQVMPFHFEANENMLDPATNARRGASFLAFCQQSAGGDAGLAMACYNGGPSVLGRSFGTWANETQRYYLWGTGMYREAISNQRESITLDSWQNAGGASLCQRAETALQ